MQDIFAPLVNYKPPVRIGSWFEKDCLEEDEIRNYITKRRTGALLTQKTRRMFSNLYVLREVELTKASPIIKFGDVVQIIAAGLPLSKDFKDNKPALSFLITENKIIQSQQIDEYSILSIGPSTKPCVRNTFTIQSADGVLRNGEALKFGQKFLIESTQGGYPNYVIFCSPKCQNLSTIVEPSSVASANGELVLPLGVRRKTDSKNFADVPYADAYWKCQHPCPSMRFKLKGQPVPSNSTLLITHVNTNRNLAVENVVFPTFFGNEYLVAVHNYLDGRKQVQWQNIWSIHLGSVAEPTKTE